MKLRIAAAAVAAALVAAGPASAASPWHLPQPAGPTLDVTMSGPSGVVWTGTCQAFIYEETMSRLPSHCRPHGNGQIRWLEGMGVTSVVKTYQGQPATSDTISPDGRSMTTVTNPGPWLPLGPFLHGFTFPQPAAQVVETCPIVNHVLSETLPCQTNQAFKDWQAAYEAASLQYRTMLQADLQSGKLPRVSSGS
jgi:hypothetical protein